MLIDLAFGVLMVLAIFKGYQKGFVIAVFSLLAFIIGLAAALKLSTVVAAYLHDSTSISVRWLPLVAFLLVFLVVVILVTRSGIKGGETRVFDARGPQGMRFTLAEPFSALLLDDARVIHETTPIQPDGEPGVRDTLVITYRRSGFQDPV